MIAACVQDGVDLRRTIRGNDNLAAFASACAGIDPAIDVGISGAGRIQARTGPDQRSPAVFTARYIDQGFSATSNIDRSAQNLNLATRRFCSACLHVALHRCRARNGLDQHAPTARPAASSAGADPASVT